MCAEENHASTTALPYFPPIVNIEVVRGLCSCSCVHCPVGVVPKQRRAAHFGIQHMSWRLFEKIANEVANNPGTCLRFHATGDPLFWGDLRTALSLTRSLGIKSWIFTSCVTRDEAALDILADCASIIEISINSRSRSDYIATKGVDAWDLVCSNLEYLRRRISTSNVTPRLILSRVESADAAEDAAFVQFWRSSGAAADVFTRSYHNYNGLLISPNKRTTSRIPVQRPPCLVHWGRFNVSCAGKAVACFNELFRPTIRDNVILGDILTETIEQVWHSEKLNAIRLAEKQGSYLTLSLPCSSCDMSQPLGGERPTSERQLVEILPC